MKKLLLPDPEYFQSDDKETPPLLRFYDWVVRASNPVTAILYEKEGEMTSLMKHVDVSKIIIHDTYDDKLRKVTKRFLMKKYKLYAKQADKEIAWHFLDIGPSTRKLDGKNKSKFHVYLDEGFIKGRKDE